MKPERLEWRYGYRRYTLEPEGHLWRMTAFWEPPSQQKAEIVDLGIVPGGIFAAFANLLNQIESAKDSSDGW